MVKAGLLREEQRAQDLHDAGWEWKYVDTWTYETYKISGGGLDRQ